MRTCTGCRKQIPDTADCVRDHDKRTFCMSCAERAKCSCKKAVNR